MFIQNQPVFSPFRKVSTIFSTTRTLSVDDNFFTSRSIMSFERKNIRFLKIIYYGF